MSGRGWAEVGVGASTGAALTWGVNKLAPACELAAEDEGGVAGVAAKVRRVESVIRRPLRAVRYVIPVGFC